MIRIVLADDHKIVRQGICSLLEDNKGLKVIGEAADGKQALIVVSALKPDVLVTDLRMPVMNGVDLTHKVKESFPEINVVVLSMFGGEAYIYSALAAGARGYVLKQSGIQNLDTAINTVMQGKVYLSPPLTRGMVEAYISRNGKPLLDW